MGAAVFAFYLFALSTITGGLFTVLSRNPVHSVLWLILSFLSSAGLFILLGAEFVAMLMIIVYFFSICYFPILYFSTFFKLILWTSMYCFFYSYQYVNLLMIRTKTFLKYRMCLQF